MEQPPIVNKENSDPSVKDLIQTEIKFNIILEKIIQNYDALNSYNDHLSVTGGNISKEERIKGLLLRKSHLEKLLKKTEQDIQMFRHRGNALEY